MKVILRNVNLFHPLEKIDEKQIDIIIVDGRISKIGRLTEEETVGVKVFELGNKTVVPGFMDMHVHLREPGREDEETVKSGCDSAAAGGFTAIACMPNTEPAIDSAEIITLIKREALGHLVDVFPIGAATLGRKGDVISPMAELKDAGAVGFSDDGVSIRSSAILKRAMEYSLMYNLPIIEHCEDESLSDGAMNEGINSTILGLPPLPSVAEDIIVSRDILMAEYTGGTLHIAHLSTKKSVELVREAQKRGIKVTAEASPHHFTLTDDTLKSYDTNLKMNPPLRGKNDRDAIIEGLKDGTIGCIASDHAPHSPEEKEAEFESAPNGIIGLETEVGLVLTELYHKKKLNITQVIEKLSINPRKILNIPIPSFRIGEVGNFTLLDLNEVWTVDISGFKSKSKNSPFDKKLLNGKAVGVINKSKMFFQGGYIQL
jgi:dihydroorotase